MEEQDLFQSLGSGSIPTSPLQMKISVVRYDTALNFYKKWHYLKNTDFLASVNFGAYFENILRGVISFGTPNANNMFGLYDETSQNGWYEIKRLAMDDIAPKYSESRFIAITIKILRKMFKVIGLISLADDSFGHKGIIYKASGFEYKGLTDKKSDYILNGKKIQRGKVSGLGGTWVSRSRKHLFIKKFI